MGKILTLAALLLFIAGLYAQERFAVSYNFKHRVTFDDDKWRSLLSQKKYDSVISLCAHKQYPFADEMIALAEAYEALGLHDSALYFVHKKLDKDINEGHSPFTIIEDYTWTPSLCNNKSIEDIITHRYKSFYAKDGHSNWEAGFSLLYMNYKWNSTETKAQVQQQQCGDEECRQEIAAYLTLTQNGIAKQLSELWAINKGYITEYAAGPWYTYQTTLSDKITDADFRSEIADPIYTSAFEQGKINADQYVDRLVRAKAASRGAMVYDSTMRTYRDSLCLVYNCDTSFRHFYIIEEIIQSIDSIK